MKKLFLLLIVVAVITGCSKHEAIDSPQSNDDNLYLKDYVMTLPLMAGQHIDIGTVSILDAEDGFIEITYNLTGGWTMDESHVFAGPDSDKPVNKPGSPKIGKFPFKEDHDPAVSTFTYVVPAGDPNDPEAFSIAAHCAVRGPNGQGETGWASGNHTFNDKGWGTYIYDFYNNATYVNNDFYGIENTGNGDLILSLINGGANRTDVIMIESVSANGTVQAAAYDPLTGDLFFVIGNTLYVNNLNGEDLSVVAGVLSGLPVGGVFLDGNYYYVDGDPNSPNYMEIIEVTLTFDPNTGNWSLSENSDYSDAIPYDLAIIDLATDGNIIYFIGVDDNDTPNDNLDDWVDMFTFDGTDFSPITTTQLGPDSQIAFGADGLMYAIVVDANGNNVLSLVSLGSGDVDPATPGDGPIKDGDNGEIPSSDQFGEFVDRR